jgi:subtilisin family serine protease
MRIWKLLLIPTLLCAVLFTPLMAPIQAHEPQPPPRAASPVAYEPGQLLVKFRPEASAAARENRLAALGLSTLQEMGDLGISLLAVPAGQEQAMIARLRQDPLVEFAEPNYRVEIPQIVPEALPALTRPELTQLAVSSTITCTQIYTPVTPNDYYYWLSPQWNQWNLPKICLPEAWSATTGATNVVIAIISSGVDVSHPDLQSKIWSNPGETPCNGLDDDGNGFVDDVHGWNFVGGNNDVTDDSGIGTYVAGIAAAATNNSLGIAGVSWGAKILPIRVYGVNHADIAEVILGLNYAANLRQRWQMPMVVLLLGDLGGYSDAYQAAVYDAHAKGCLLVANSGDTNDPCNANCTCPINWLAAAAYVIGVSSTDEDDAWVPSSKCGFYVDFCAPGKDVLFTIPGGSYGAGRSTYLAAAHVAGLASLIWSVNPTYQADLVEILMRWTAVDLGVPGWDMYFGYGRIDAARAILEAGHYLQVLPNEHHLTFIFDPLPSVLTQTLTNPGTSLPAWQAETNVPWLTISPPVGEQHTPSTLIISLTTSPLWQYGYGVYTAPITVSSTMPNNQNSPQVFTVTAIYTSPVQTLAFPRLFYHYLDPADCGP